MPLLLTETREENKTKTTFKKVFPHFLKNVEKIISYAVKRKVLAYIGTGANK